MKMAVYTRNEIKTAFVLLLDERPFTKITVKDVVLKCGVNRNTFYYYFRDLPDLAEADARGMSGCLYPICPGAPECGYASLSFNKPGTVYFIHKKGL